MNILEYEGYSGSAEISVEDNCLHGKILFIRDLVAYQASTPDDLKKEFISAVDDYIQTCREYGKAPDKPCKGSFNIRISPELHRKAVLESLKNDVSLNEIVSKAIDQYVNKIVQPAKVELHDHHHKHYHQHDRVRESVSITGKYGSIGEDKWKSHLAIVRK